MNNMGSDEHQGWEPIGSTGRFFQTSLPMSRSALDLCGGRGKTLIYGEFDTGLEPEAWRAFLYDPLRVLSAEGVLDAIDAPDRHLEIEIVKFAGPEEYEADYRKATEARGKKSAKVYDGAALHADTRGAWRVTTVVVNHEQPLNPRIGAVTIVV
ncbi:MAG: hypothetical protein WEA29_08285 [Acidimicrobiia bacterium]